MISCKPPPSSEEEPHIGSPALYSYIMHFHQRKPQWHIATDQKILHVGFQAAEHLQSFIADCDRRTELAKKRLAETQDEISAEVTAKVTTVALTPPKSKPTN